MKEKKKKEKDNFRFFFMTISILTAVVVILVGFVVVILEYNTSIARIKVNIYPLLTTVTGVDRDKDLVTVEDNNGFIWQFEGADDWEEGDLCNCLMDSQGTEKIFDDEIIMTKYESGAR